MGSGPSRLRLGVIGLGRNWETRHRPALSRLRDRFAISAVYDQVARRAETEASSFHCAVAGGIAALIERRDVDAIYLLAPQWFGLFPAELACKAKKPIYCAVPIAAPELESLATLVRSTGTPFVPELARRFYPVTIRLRELLATVLGRPRLILGQTRSFGFDRYGAPGPTTQLEPAPLLVDPGSFLLDWCRCLFQCEPVAVQGTSGTLLPSGDSWPDFLSFTLEFPGGEMAQVALGRYHRAAWGEASRFLPQSGFQVFAERGVAWLEMPDRIQWSDANGCHEERLPMEPTVGELLNDHFHRLVCGEPTLAPSIEDAVAVSRLVTDLSRSIQEGRRITQEPKPDAPGAEPGTKS